MTRPVLLVTLFLLPLFVHAQSRADLTVYFPDLAEMKGTLFIKLQDAEGKDLVERKLPVRTTGASPQTTFLALPVGKKYAIRVFHDVNDNGELDTNFFGYPQEPYGFSNNVRGVTGPPSFEDQLFLWTGEERIEIRLE